MREAHQIIYTSCRRGIQGAGDGLQVFSYDEGLPGAGLDVGTGFHRLLPFDVPRTAGATAFGYAPVEGCGAVWACNTKLPHDYMGPGGRAGNVLRHAVVLPADQLDFHPIELACAAFWRRSMAFDEVNAEEPPAFLPPVDASPAGAIDERGTRWSLSGTVEMEAAARLARATVLAASEGRSVAILEGGTEALRWVAVATYSLPLTLARQVSFVVGCDNLATAGAILCGISREDFERNTPAYVRDACLVFDPRDGLVRDASGVLESGGFDEGPYPRTVVGASFEALVERGWRECPDELAAFRDLCDRDLRVGLDLEELDRAFEVYRATRMGLHRLLDPVGTLAFIEERGTERFKQVMAGRVLDSIAGLDEASAEAAVAYVLRRWSQPDERYRGHLLTMLTSMMMEAPARSRAFLDAAARCFAALSAAMDTLGPAPDDDPRAVEPVAGRVLRRGAEHLRKRRHAAGADGGDLAGGGMPAGGPPRGGSQRRPLFGGRGGFPFGKGKGR